MNKKIKMIILCLFVTIIGVNNIDAKSQSLSKIVKSKYNNNTKELYIWGANHSGNLGTGNYNAVSETNMIKVNDLIGKQKIIEYAITDSQTYVLTDKNKVYASGYRIGNGTLNKNTPKFTELKFYNSSKFKIKSMNIINSLPYNECQDRELYLDGCSIDIQFKTSNSNVNHLFRGTRHIPLTPARGNWFHNFMFWEFNDCGDISDIYPVYFDARIKNKLSLTIVNKNGKLHTRYIIKEKQRRYAKALYTNGVLRYQGSFSDKKNTITYYKNGKRSSKKVTYFKLMKYKERYRTKEHNYTYKNGVLKTRYTYQRTDKKMMLIYKKFYYPNKKNQFRSNKNGKAKTYLTHYRNKKAYKTYRYYYNKNNKMIMKKNVKIKTRY